MKLSDFDYELPEELIAQEPLPERDASRMMVVNRERHDFRDSHFLDFPNQLAEGDVVVLNNTRVFPARLIGERSPSGGRVELLLLRDLGSHKWEALARPARRLKPGTNLRFGNELAGEVIESGADGLRVIRFDCAGDLADFLERIGQTPLPPYIKRDQASAGDRERYQTVYATNRGAIAAPTAGLHFTKRVLDQLSAIGASVVEITLHVGYGTFEPVRTNEISQHRVAAEWYSISAETAAAINEAHRMRASVVAIGTTTTRALESATTDDGGLIAGSGMAALTIVPGFQFRTVDALLTNFHLPVSSLMLLVSAFAGKELVQRAYQHAVKERYRFYSYGDCMLIA